MAEKPKSDVDSATSKPAARPKQGRSDYIAHVVTDPANPPECVVVAGYLGDSSLDGHVRLYLHPDLGDYREIPEDAILHQVGIAGDPLGGFYIWVRRDAEVRHKGSAPPQG